MNSLTKSVNSILNTMHNQIGTEKGSYGELAVFSVCEEIYKECNGILILSYTYNTVKGLAGNIKKHNGKLYVENSGNTTEIDVLLATPFRIFPIEVKAYKANTIRLSNFGISGCNVTDKSPEHQNEYHCRHLYPNIFQALPDGISKYIVPIVCFVDNCTVIDERDDIHKDYIKVSILNNLKSLILECNKPLNSTTIDLISLERRLKNNMISSERFLPYVRK